MLSGLLADLMPGKPWATKQRQTKQSREAFMGVNTSGGHPAMDYAEHNRTYANFLGWTKVTIVFLVVLLSGMAYFLV
jgi:hypothetical protein